MASMKSQILHSQVSMHATAKNISAGKAGKRQLLELDDASYAQRLEEEERYSGTRSTQLPIKSEGVPSADERSRNLIPDPWINSDEKQIMIKWKRLLSMKNMKIF